MAHTLDPHLPAMLRLAMRRARCPVTFRRETWAGLRFVVFEMHGPRARRGLSPEIDVTLALIGYCQDHGVPGRCLAEAALDRTPPSPTRFAARARRPRVAARRRDRASRPSSRA